ncbi:hypothetical protein ES702_07032 [subsurface metagenome]
MPKTKEGGYMKQRIKGYVIDDRCVVLKENPYITKKERGARLNGLTSPSQETLKCHPRQRLAKE